MINRVVLIGRLTKDPTDLRRSANGTAFLSFTIAVDNRSKNEERSADFIPCVAFNKTAEILNQYTRKGSQVGVEGRLQTRTYESRENPGKKVFVMEVICDNITLLDSKSASQSPTASPMTRSPEMVPSPARPRPAAAPKEDTYETQVPPPGVDVSDDDLPF